MWITKRVRMVIGVVTGVVCVACTDRGRPSDRGADAPLQTAAPTGPTFSITRVDTLAEADGTPFTASSLELVALRGGGAAAIHRDQSRVVRFDSSGRLLGAAGRNGSGPGEFQSPWTMFSLPGDSLAVWDMALRRLSVFDGAMHYARAARFDSWNSPQAFGTQLVGRFADGRWVGLITKNGPFIPREEAGARTSVDTQLLVAGRDGEVATELFRLPLKHVVEVVFMKGLNSTVYKLSLKQVFEGIGAVCERGVVLVDALGVRDVDTHGIVMATNALPRTGDSIRTQHDRDVIVNGNMFGGIDTSAFAATVRVMLNRRLAGVTVRAATPIIDTDGRLWYVRQPLGVSSVIDRVDRQGRIEASVQLSMFEPGARIDQTSIAIRRFGSDTSDMSAVLARLPQAAVNTRELPLGRCAAPFQY